MHLLKNISLLYTCGVNDSVIANGAVAWSDGKIAWVGAASDIPKEYAEAFTHDAKGRIVTPAFIDCHTHLAFAGWRVEEFVQRCKGTSYADILKQGGGILSTVKATRSISEDELFERAAGFCSEILKLGVKTIECKSGYGLDLETELKILRVYKRLSANSGARIVSTFLGAHTFPAEFGNKKQDYVNFLISEALPEVARAGLATFCDIFVEEEAFTITHAEKVLVRAAELGFKLKLHVDQLRAGAGAELAARLGATSADHLEYVSEQGLKALAASGTVAVALPIASLYLRKKPFDARSAIDHGVQVALATDFNPGSAPSYDLTFAMLLGCTMNGLTPREALRAVTTNAARALGLQESIGSVSPGYLAEFALIDATSLEQYMYNFSACHSRPVVEVVTG